MFFVLCLNVGVCGLYCGLLNRLVCLWVDWLCLLLVDYELFCGCLFGVIVMICAKLVWVGIFV